MNSLSVYTGVDKVFNKVIVSSGPRDLYVRVVITYLTIVISVHTISEILITGLNLYM